MVQPTGYINPTHPDHVCLLKKSLYGLKQSPRQWYKKFDSFVLGIGFIRSQYDNCFYFILSDIPVYLLLYVDDILIISKSKDKISELKSMLNTNFDMKNLGPARKILGMTTERERSKSSLKIHQHDFLVKAVQRFGMHNYKAVGVPLAGHFALSKSQCPTTNSELVKMENIPYANAIGTVMYSMISTRPDLAYSISLLSRYMSNPGKTHWDALKYMLRYINGTVDIGLCYKRRFDALNLVGYVDSDFAGDRDSRKSTTAYFFTLGGNCISWKSQLQPLVALSTTEAEYVAVTDAFKEAIWLQGLLKEIQLLQDKVTVFSDSQSAIHLSKNPVYHERTKHVEVRYHYVRDLIANGIVSILKVLTKDNPADMGTKTLTATKFKHCFNLLNVGVG